MAKRPAWSTDVATESSARHFTDGEIASLLGEPVQQSGVMTLTDRMRMRRAEQADQPVAMITVKEAAMRIGMNYATLLWRAKNGIVPITIRPSRQRGCPTYFIRVSDLPSIDPQPMDRGVGAEKEPRGALGEMIRSIRKRHRMHQTVFADLCGVHGTTVSQWESGRALPSPHHCWLIVNGLLLSAEEELKLYRALGEQSTPKSMSRRLTAEGARHRVYRSGRVVTEQKEGA